MQLVSLIAVFALATISVLTDDTTQLKEDEAKRVLTTTRVKSPASEESRCVCKVGHLEFGYKVKQSHDRTGNKCPCQKAINIIKRKWKDVVLSRKGRTKRYCLKPGKTLWRGQRRFYCVESWHRVKKCKSCNPISFIPTPL
ncbi:hypothetical protein scyTo_0013081 [Scyliorhinus torazame]|uniref:Chemokine interleukin-8-like domain-containing protein n=1 Tax=Scyliorhinus torazame TaxID=75743 RepID=A0A401NNW6_SCYTO|nr:hypothetical protein [Scyliorhinus torazame]